MVAIQPVLVDVLALVRIPARTDALILADMEQLVALSNKNYKERFDMSIPITVEIETHESEAVERLFYLHNAGQDNIAFLMKDKDIRYEILQEYIDVTECRYVELEMLKEELAEKYKPKDGKDYNYLFDFRNKTMIFTEM
jgi:hypothetical protein